MLNPAANTLTLTVCLIGLELTYFGVLLYRRNLFHWLSAGFWSWVSLLLYFVITPFLAVITSNTENFDLRLQVSGGEERGEWVALVIFIAILVFFTTYLNAKAKVVTFGPPEESLWASPLFFLWFMFFLSYGGYSLLATRSGLATWSGDKIIIGGQFLGDITGYQNAGYVFLFVPTLLLLQWPSTIGRICGAIIAYGFIFFSLPHAWSRFITISLLIALSMTLVFSRRRKWPPLIFAVGIFLFALIYQARGHVSWEYSNMETQLQQSIAIAKNNGISALAQNDTQMLATFWVESYLYDSWMGYNYGVPLINYAVTGWIPSRVFPDKYFLIDWLRSYQPSYHPPILDRLLFGAKSTLIGAGYRNGGLLGVILGMLLVGRLSRRLDGMLVPGTSIFVRSLGFAWLSNLWMVWGSGEQWALMLLGTICIPIIVLWIFLKPEPQKRSFAQSRNRQPESNR